MNHAAILALISDLYSQISVLSQENARLSADENNGPSES